MSIELKRQLTQRRKGAKEDREDKSKLFDSKLHASNLFDVLLCAFAPLRETSFAPGVNHA
jgi:hypothetical protein